MKTTTLYERGTGASVRRTFIPKDKEIKDIIGKDLSASDAQYVLAERLIKDKMYTDVNIKVRTHKELQELKRLYTGKIEAIICWAMETTCSYLDMKQQKS